MHLAILMDPFEKLAVQRDSSIMMIEAALERGIQVYVFDSSDIFMENQFVFSRVREVLSCDIQAFPSWYALGEPFQVEMTYFQAVLIRKDPPFDMDYIFLTYLMEYAERQGVRVLNPPEALRRFNEKLVIFNFPDSIAPTLVASNKETLRQFWEEQSEIILKPLDGLGGRHVFHLKREDPNFTSIWEMLTHQGKRPIMAQRYLKEARLGDKRILIIDGKPVPLALARLQREGETRSGLAMGGGFNIQALTDRDQFICEQVAPFLKAQGILLAGLDVIGDYMTEINITSPTGLRQLSEASGQNLAALFLDSIFS